MCESKMALKFVRDMSQPLVMRPLMCLLTIITLIMAFLPQPPTIVVDQFGDKFEHMLAFTILTSVALLGWPQSGRLRIFLLLSMLGALIELVQAAPVLNRDSDWHDWLADTLAIFASLAIVDPMLRLLRIEPIARAEPLREPDG